MNSLSPLSENTAPCNIAAAHSDDADAMPDHQAAGGAAEHRAVAALLEGAAKYRMLIEHIPAITYIAAWDVESSTLYTSPQIESMLGFARAEWMADPTRWLTQIHPEDRAFVLAELAHLHGGGAPKPCEYRMLTRDGRVRWFRDETAILKGEAGQPLYLYGVMLDITERVQLETELKNSQQKLVQAQETRQLELAQELEDAVVCHLTKLHDRLGQIQRATGVAAGAYMPSLAAIFTELDKAAQEVLVALTTLRERVAELRAARYALPHLTVRQLAVLRLLALGKNNREIAQVLGISRKTIEKHVGNLYTKLEVHSRAEAVAWAAHERLI
jgi:PAS domain S-box-containing protein